MDLPLDVEVRCTDGVCGRSTALIIDPLTRSATHLVVREKGFLGIERMVPLALVGESSPRSVQLRCDRAHFQKQETFIEAQFVTADEYWMDDRLPMMDWEEAHVLWPHTQYDPQGAVVEVERVPPGEIGIRRGAHVHATDGQVGVVDELVVHPDDGQITHLLLRAGHLWHKRDVAIPVSAIQRIEDDHIYLTLDRHAVATLPHLPVRRTAPFPVQS